MSFTQKRIYWAWLFLMPTLIVLLLIAGFPLLQTFKYSFTNAFLDTLRHHDWVGFHNYQYLLQDPSWWSSVQTTLWFTVISVSLETTLGLGIALMLNQHFVGRGWLRAAILIPWAIPTVVSSKIWEWLYHDQFGFINEFLKTLGLIEESIAFMGNPDLLLSTIIVVDVWKTTPFMVLLILAGLTTIPKEIYDAAKIDGASAAQVFFQITLPLLKPTLMVAVIFRSLDAMRVFDLIYVMQGSNERTASISIYARQQMIDFQDIGLGSAASVAIFLLIGGLTVLYLRLFRVNFND